MGEGGGSCKGWECKWGGGGGVGEGIVKVMRMESIGRIRERYNHENFR